MHKRENLKKWVVTYGGRGSRFTGVRSGHSTTCLFEGGLSIGGGGLGGVCMEKARLDDRNGMNFKWLQPTPCWTEIEFQEVDSMHFSKKSFSSRISESEPIFEHKRGVGHFWALDKASVVLLYFNVFTILLICFIWVGFQCEWKEKWQHFTIIIYLKSLQYLYEIHVIRLIPQSFTDFHFDCASCNFNFNSASCLPPQFESKNRVGI